MGLFERSKVRGVVNIGPNTRPGTFSFHGNHWFASDAPKRSRPQLPAVEEKGIYGIDPQLDPATRQPKTKLDAGRRPLASS